MQDLIFIKGMSSHCILGNVPRSSPSSGAGLRPFSYTGVPCTFLCTSSSALTIMSECSPNVHGVPGQVGYPPQHDQGISISLTSDPLYLFSSYFFCSTLIKKNSFSRHFTSPTPIKSSQCFFLILN